ncbi:hypothetical protein LCGC14_1518300 [marine sediment metagenome]|uniref:Uncharacterized protein n=1 Tax=marine sediment metagenome TaxID=412755 RepID=A0A0F9LF34_9ZZZZ
MFTWTENKPTKTGWYWIREDSFDTIVLIKRFADGRYGRLCVQNRERIPDNALWAGPISAPVEKSKKSDINHFNDLG